MLRVLARSSPLALVQVREVFEKLPDIVYTIHPFQTYGDAHKELSLLDPQRPDFFTDTIDRALLAGEGDIAIHSAKDLPWPLTPGLEVIALTRCLDNTDALVSKNNLSLEKLPVGACVGTSSLKRRHQLMALRPDLAVAGIRGTIEERIAQVDNGHVDALIVATCALKRLGIETRIAQILPFVTHPLQGMVAVVAKARNPGLMSAFAVIDSRYNYGKVWLVGAGPGDPDLLTRKAEKIISNADVIVYDSLVNERILSYSPALKLFVGKRKNIHSQSQDEINQLLYENARAGKRTVRLKGGDSLIYSRLGEEIDYLRERCVPVEVVPGISSLQAAAAELMMPLTQRGRSDSLVVLSGHQASKSADNTKTNPTFAFFMGASEKEHVASLLEQQELLPSTNVALIRNASLPDEKRVLTDLSELAQNQLPSPVIILAGGTVPTGNLPKRILYTGLDSTECMLDGVVVHFPFIKTESLPMMEIDFKQYQGIVFTSQTAVRCFFGHYGKTALPVYSIGPRTSHEVERFAHQVTAQSQTPDAVSLNSMVQQIAGDHHLIYPCSSLSRNPLHENRFIHPVALYETKLLRPAPVSLDGYSGVVFSSPSTAESFFKTFAAFPEHLVAFVYGKPSRDKLREKGVSEEQIITIPVGEHHG